MFRVILSVPPFIRAEAEGALRRDSVSPWAQIREQTTGRQPAGSHALSHSSTLLVGERATDWSTYIHTDICTETHMFSHLYGTRTELHPKQHLLRVFRPVTFITFLSFSFFGLFRLLPFLSTMKGGVGGSTIHKWSMQYYESKGSFLTILPYHNTATSREHICMSWTTENESINR